MSVSEGESGSPNLELGDIRSGEQHSPWSKIELWRRGASLPRDPLNILITGEPGTRKTRISELTAEATGLNHINAGDLVKAKFLHEGLDTEYDSYILDEDKV
ncbi:hypothetical protein BGZ51_000434 [Haplosporangium sp. Z 767]|nr:hypothetical protein BGZ51_000434 [Haplosporangium sp. Z 767]